MSHILPGNFGLVSEHGPPEGDSVTVPLLWYYSHRVTLESPSYLEDHPFVVLDLARKAPPVTRTTTDLAKWLDKYGLGEYAQTFAENHIVL